MVCSPRVLRVHTEVTFVAENGGRSHTEVTICIYGRHTQESMDGPGMFTIPAGGGIRRENDVFPVPVRA